MMDFKWMGESVKRRLVLRCHSRRSATIVAVSILVLMLCCSLASADETQATLFSDRYFFQGPTTSLSDMGFFLSFSERYYQAVDKSLKDKSYFVFRYFLISPFESFDKGQYISENPREARGLAWDALHIAVRQTVENIEVIEIFRDYVSALTSLQMVFGAEGTRLYGPSLSGVRIQDSAPEKNPTHAMALSGGLSFGEDLRPGVTVAMANQRIMSKLSYYPADGNEIGYTVEARLTSATKFGLSYRKSQNGDAVLTNVSFLF